MDRLGVLIERLNKQYQQDVQAAQMLVTVQMIQQEIAEKNISVATTPSKVAVTMPTNFPRMERNGSSNNGNIAGTAVEDKDEIDSSTTYNDKAPAVVEIETSSVANIEIANTDSDLASLDAVNIPELPLNTAPAFIKESTTTEDVVDHNIPTATDLQEPKIVYEILNAEELYGNLDQKSEILEDNVADKQPEVNAVSEELKKDYEDKLNVLSEAQQNSTPEQPPQISTTSNNLPYNPLLEVPTLAHQKEVSELNDLMAHHHSESFNEKLRPYQTELGMVLTDSPVKDLKKAIGINDRFLFISELFRGDETMYERSLKTINNFHIFPEAEYWMERELKIKLGWNENQATVKQFYQLVKRRFAHN